MSTNKNTGPIQISPDAKILIVDDSNINLKVAVAYMARHNIKAETAQSGLSAIEMIREKK
jgi:CheY-like chemotaxis protein